MAVRVRVRISTTAGSRRASAVETVAVANSGYESDLPGALIPLRLARRLGLWPPPKGARRHRFESPGASFDMVTLPSALRVALFDVRRVAVEAEAVISDRETEVIMNDALVEALRLDLVAVHRGLYRVGPRGRLMRSAEPQRW